MPSFAAALVKLRSSATARNHSRSLKSALAIGAPRGDMAGIYALWSIDASELRQLIKPIHSRYLLPRRWSTTLGASDREREVSCTQLTMRPWVKPSAAWGAVASMALSVAVLIASEFMPVSLLTPIAGDLGLTEGQAGQAISISGLFAVVTSLCNRRADPERRPQARPDLLFPAADRLRD